MAEKIEKIKELVKERFDKEDWHYHILGVVKYAKELARKYEVDKETVELAALLHDIGRVDIKNDAKHHILGISEAEKILKKFNYPKEIIEEVKHCIASHRTSQGPKPKTMIAKIVANADAMAHFDNLPLFFYWRGERRENFEDTLEWVKNKIENDWRKKITLPQAKKLTRKKYQAIKFLLDLLKHGTGKI